MNADQIIEAAADHFGVRTCDITCPGREKTRIRMRFIVAALLRDRLEMSYPEIARELGYNDHTSAMNGVRRARAQRELNWRWDADFKSIERSLLTWREERAVESLEMSA